MIDFSGEVGGSESALCVSLFGEDTEARGLLVKSVTFWISLMLTE